MTIERLHIKNFKTYATLDINLATETDRSIILIGGVNGGGKTTFFEAIHGALYGLNITKQWQFEELVNAAATQPLSKQEIELTIDFSRPTKEDIQKYQLQRIYKCLEESVRESVLLKVGKLSFQYGSRTPIEQRIAIEKEIAKVIQTNLPKSLSRYFLFDAMEAGSLLRREKLQTVIKENIEQVMGFDRYLQLERAADKALQAHKNQQIKQELNRKTHQKWLSEQEVLLQHLDQRKKDRQAALHYAAEQEQAVQQLQIGKNQEELIQEKLIYLEQEMKHVQQKEERYIATCDQFIQRLESNIGLPLVAKELDTRIRSILNAQQEQANSIMEKTSIETIVQKILKFLQARKLLKKQITAKTIVPHLLTKKVQTTIDTFLTKAEMNALQKLLLLPKQQPYTAILEQQKDLESVLLAKEKHTRNLSYYQSKLSSEDFSLLEAYQKNEVHLQDCKKDIRRIEFDLKILATKLADFEKEMLQAPDQKLQQLQQLKTFFERFGLQLLANKKEKIEAKMKTGLNQLLGAYKGMIDRVTLPQDLKNLTFEIFHKKGNKIHLHQLNTASKQIVVQCLLKALHDHGNYHPPVLIDTVMGVLDEESRGMMLDHFLPKLSHQTILLSSDSEIRKATDYPRLAPFIAKTYTLERNKVTQQTILLDGYFDA